MNVLSLFDGMSCGQQALERAGIEVNQYFASEIDKYAIQVTMANYPNTIQLGSVVGVDGYSLPKIDLLIGGSPCQSFSFAGKRKGMATTDEQEILTLEHYLQLKSEGYEFEGQSYLFWEFMRLLYEVKPKYFLLENVEMGEKWEGVLTQAIGVHALHINSALVSAQNRKRIYFTNIGLEPGGLFGYPVSIIEKPKDKKILLKDILESEIDEKYFLSERMIKCLDSKKGTTYDTFYPADINDKGRTINSRMAKMGSGDNYIVHNTMPRSSTTGKGGTGHLSRNDGKTYCLDTGNTNAVEIVLTSKDKRLQKIVDDNVFIEGEVAHLDTYNQTIDKNKSPALTLPHNNRFIIAPTGNTNAVEIVAMRGRPNKEGGYTPKFETNNSGKSNCLTTCQKENLLKQSNAVEVREVKQLSTNNKSNGGTQPYQQDRIYDVNGISPALQAQLPNGSTMINTSRIRRLTPLECMRLQTVNDNYKMPVSDSQRYKMLGNGWTIEVISHIFKYIL